MNNVRYSVASLAVSLILVFLIGSASAASRDRYWVDRLALQVLYGPPNQRASSQVVLQAEDGRLARDPRYWEALEKFVRLLNLPDREKRRYADRITTTRRTPFVRSKIKGMLLAVEIDSLTERPASRRRGQSTITFHLGLTKPDSPLIGHVELDYQRDPDGIWRFDNDIFAFTD